MKTSMLAMMATLAAITTTILAADSGGKNESSDATGQTNQNNGIIIRQDGRQECDISLDGEWDFTFTPTTVKEIPDFPSDSAFDAKVKIPGYWDNQWDNFKNASWWPKVGFATAEYEVKYLSGIGWHRKMIDVPSAWSGRPVTLTMGGRAPGLTYVWINRRLVGRYDHGGYTPFSFDLTGQLKAGEKNELIIGLDNGKRWFSTKGGFFGACHGNASGIAGSVSLHVSEGAGRIYDVYVRAGADLKEVVWGVDLDVPESVGNMSESKLLWEVCKATDNAVIAEGEFTVPAFKQAYKASWKQKIDAVEPWSDRNPNLYRTKIQWLSGNQVLDKREERFGLRQWSAEGRKLFLNGKPIYLRGDLGSQWDFSIYANMPVSKEYWMTRLKRAKELGFNYVDFELSVPPPALLETADELGMIIFAGDKYTAYKEYRQYYRDVWRPIVAWTRNHPSMSVYVFGAESGYYEGCLEQFQKQYDLVKGMNSECMVMASQGMRWIEYDCNNEPKELKDPEGLTQKPFLHNAKRLAIYAKANDIFGSFNAGSGGFGYNFFATNTPWRFSEKCLTIYQHPVVTHEVYMRSSYLNPDNAAKYTERIPPVIYDRMRKQLADAGLSDRWRTYWENSGKLNSIARKFCMEKTRKCDNLAGYQLLGLSELNIGNTCGYLSGMLDELLQFKPGDDMAGILRYSNESVLLLDFEDDGGINRSFWAKDSLPADIMLSLYGPNPITKGQLAWVLKETESGREVLKGECELKDIRNGYVNTIHSLKIEWPEVKKTTKLNFSVSLAGSGYQLVNDWDFWVFPKLAPPEVSAAADASCQKILAGRYPKISPLTVDSKEKLHVVSAITQKEVDYLLQGGDVLLLGTRPFPTQGNYGYPGMATRLGLTVGAIINEKHPIFEGLPDEGWGDWIFMPLLAHAPRIWFCKTECSALDITPFNPILEMISMPGRVDKQAAIFEAQVGKGRLLVSTCQANLNNPSRITLVDGLLRYASGNEFRPEMKLGTEVLTALVQGQNKPKAPPASSVSISMDKTAGRVWYSHPNRRLPITVDFKSNMFYRLNKQDWKEGSKVDIGWEGIQKIVTKPTALATNEESREVCIDRTPPTIYVRATPMFEQLANALYITPETFLTIEAKDGLSGVKSIEVSIDGAQYTPYTGSFKLPVGTHSVRCLVTDQAGNQEETMDGENMAPTRNIMVTVRVP